MAVSPTSVVVMFRFNGAFSFMPSYITAKPLIPLTASVHIGYADYDRVGYNLTTLTPLAQISVGKAIYITNLTLINIVA